MSEQFEQEKQEAALAAEMQVVTGSRAFNNAITLRKAQIFELFCNTGKDQGDIREEAWRTMKNMNALENYFQEIAETGKMAQVTLDANPEDSQ